MSKETNIEIYETLKVYSPEHMREIFGPTFFQAPYAIYEDFAGKYEIAAFRMRF